MSSLRRRYHEHKSWAQLFDDRCEAEKSSSGKSTIGYYRRTDKYTPQRIYQAKWIIATIFGKIVKERMKTSGFSCRKTVANVNPPDYVNEESNSWGAQSLCYLCNLPSLFESFMCKTCNAVGHKLCVNSVAQKFKIRDVSKDECLYCLKSLQEDYQYYEKCQSELMTKRTKKHLESIVECRVLTFIRRKEFFRARRSAILIQSFVRRYFSKKVFFMWRRTQLRVVMIEFDKIIPPLLDRKGNRMQSRTQSNGLPSGKFILTVVDPIRHLQMFRLEKDLNACSVEGFMIAGITALMTVVGTVYLEDSAGASYGTKRYIIAGQMCLSLRDIKSFLIAHSYPDIPFSTNILNWLPQENKVITKTQRFYVPVRLNTLPLSESLQNEYCIITAPQTGAKRDYSKQIIAPLSVSKRKSELKNTEKKDDDFGKAATFSPSKLTKLFSNDDVLAERIEEEGLDSPFMETSIAGSKRDISGMRTGEIFMTDAARPNTTAGSTRGKAPVSSFKSSSFDASLAETVEPPGNPSCTIRYIPCNPISALCMRALAPSLDILKRRQALKDAVAGGTSNESMRARSPYWLCLNDLWLYFFQDHGDASAKLMVDLKDVSITQEKAPLLQMLNLNFADGRKWSFEFEDGFSAGRFKFAVSECQFSLGGGKSIFCKNIRTNQYLPLNFTCPMR